MVFALEMEHEAFDRSEGLVSILSVDLSARGRFGDLRVIHCDSAERNSNRGAPRGRREAFNRVPTLTPRPCPSDRTVASDVVVQEACSVLGLPPDMARSEIMTMCRTMLLTYVATKMPVPPSHGAGCEWWQWAPAQH